VIIECVRQLGDATQGEWHSRLHSDKHKEQRRRTSVT